MKVKYLLHSDDYAIGENEKLYADQAAKGWLLEKRGSWFSKFRRGEPQRLRYRIELSARNIRQDEGNLPEEQIALYEECGWRFVTCRGRVHVFSAPEFSGAPEFYSTPEQQADMLNGLRREYWSAWAVTAAILGLLLLFMWWKGNGDNGMARLWTEVKMDWVAYTGSVLCRVSPLVLTTYQLVYGTVRTAALYRRLKRGEPLDHAPQKRYLVHKAVTAVLAACVIASLVLISLQLISFRSYDMPARSDGPYLVLAELGVSGERIDNDQFDTHCTVETDRSLVARMWYTREYVSTGDGKISLHQNVYQMNSPRAALRYVTSISEYIVLTRRAYGFTEIEAPGLDAVYKADGEDDYVVVKGKLIYYINIYDRNDTRPAPDILAAVAAHTP